MLPALFPEDTGLFRWGVCTCHYKIIFANATNADGALRHKVTVLLEAGKMKSEVADNPPLRQIFKGCWPRQGVIVPQD